MEPQIQHATADGVSIAITRFGLVPTGFDDVMRLDEVRRRG